MEARADTETDAVREPAPESLSDSALQFETMAEFLDSMDTVDQMVSSLLAFKAQLVDGARRFSELTDTSGWGRRVLASEIAAAQRIPLRSAEDLIANSQQLVNDLAATLEALKSGSITYRHAEKMIEHSYAIPTDEISAFEAIVLPAAETMTVSKFNARAKHVRERLHPETMSTRRAQAFEDRRVFVDEGQDGMAWLTAHLPVEQATAIYNRLTDIGRGMTCAEEDRTLPQLRADVFAELLINGELDAAFGVGPGIVARVMVTVPTLTLLGRSDTPADLEGIIPIAPEVTRKLAAGAPSFMRILTHPETGVILSVSHTRYKPPKDLQDFVRLRDGTDRSPFNTGVPARRAELDHTIPYSQGGPTSADNLASLSKGSHLLKHNGGWKVAQVGGGVMDWIAPLSGRPYTTYPETILPS